MIHDHVSRHGMSKREFVAMAMEQAPPVRRPIDELAPETAMARVDWGVWIVDCPYCPGAAKVDWGEPLTFCLSCHNEKAGHRWVAVVLPTQEERAAIEAALEGLPEDAQHWRPGQTPEDVIAARPPVSLMHPEQALQLAQSAGEERDRLAGLLEATRGHAAAERAGSLALIRVIERMKHEAAIRKQLNRELQDQIDAFSAHGHEN